MPEKLEILEDTDKSIKNLNHLGIIAGICDEIKLVSLIDDLIPCSSRQKVSYGQSVKAMIINGLGYTERTLYLTPDFYSDKPVEHLLGKGIKASYLNDDCLGETLDALFDYGVSKLFFHISYNAHKCYNLKIVSKNLDGTTLSVSGKGNADSSVVKVTNGYNKQGQHNLMQIILELIVNSNGGFPLFMSVHDGNETDKTAFAEVIEKYNTALVEENITDNSIWVADNSLYTAENIEKLSEVEWLTRAGHNLKWVKEAYQSSENEEWQLFEVHEGYKYQVIKTNYGGVKQAALIVYSTKKYQKDKHNFDKRLIEEREKYKNNIKKIGTKNYATHKEAEKALNDLLKKGNAYYNASKGSVLEIGKYKRGRKKENAQPISYYYKIETKDIEIHEKQESIEQFKAPLGKFVLVTNEIAPKAYKNNKKGNKLLKRSADELLTLYKNDQQKTERGFRFIKDPTFLLSHIFVTLPKRIVAVTMIMCLSLLIYCIAEFKLRDSLRKKEETLPNQLGKAVKNPTMKWIFRLFKGIHIEESGGKNFIIGLNELHKKILSHLGGNVSAYYGL